MSLSHYILNKTEKSHCPECNQQLYMLANENLTKVAFYICFNCKFVGQIGVGVVKILASNN